LASRQPNTLTLAAESCASVKKTCAALAKFVSAVDATGVEPGGGDEVSASDAGTLGDRVSQRSDGIVPHELRKERQFGFLLGPARAKTVVPFRPRLALQSAHDRQSLTRNGRIVPSLGWEMRDEL
jgi:hypothetical protein